MIKVEGVSKTFNRDIKAIDDVTFQIEDGEIVGFIGLNGAGKTTLFNCLNRDIEIDSGSFFFRNGSETEAVKADDIGYVLSTPTVPDILRTVKRFLSPWPVILMTTPR